MSKLIFITISILFGINLLAQIPQDSLLLYYPFSGNAQDSSGNNHHGVVNGATLVSDRFGNPNSAYFFDGSNDFIELPNVADLKPELPMSFSFWVKLETLSQISNQFFSTNPSSSYAGCTFNTTSSGSGGLNLNYGDNQGGSNGNYRRTISSEVGFSIGVWHHVVGIMSGPFDMEVYMDGVLFSGTYSGNGGSLAYSNLAGAIGKTKPNVFHWGTIDDFAYYNKALSYCEVQQLYDQSNFIETTDVHEVCDSLVWIDGNTYYSDNNTASYTYTSVEGCDSIVFLDLTINQLTNSIVNSGNQLSTNLYAGATYQWFSCNEEGLTPIIGANSNVYQIVNSGNYAVSIDYLSCSDTSECLPFKHNISLIELDFNEVIVFNNTNEKLITVNLNSSISDYSISISNLLGQNVFSSSKLNEMEMHIPTSNFNAGIYWLNFNSGNFKKSFKLVIQ